MDYGKIFVPKDFEIPKELITNNFKLRMLTTKNVDKDYEAVMSSQKEILGVLGKYAIGWPPKTMTKEEDFNDLAWHQWEFKHRRSFAYTIMNLDESKCLGCVYIAPSEKRDYNAIILFWIRKDKIELEKEFFKTLKTLAK